MSKGNFWNRFLGLFIEKPKNKQNIIQKDEDDEELEVENQIEEVEELNAVNQIDKEKPIEQEQIEQKNEEENIETHKEYTTVDYNAMLEEQEERIKKAGNMPEEEKQKLIDELYKNFEIFVGETNNSEKTR